jgi:hypothetical protein
LGNFLKPILFFYILSIYHCGSTYNQKPRPDEMIAKIALDSLDHNIRQSNKNISGVGQQIDGALIEKIDEVEHSHIQDYETGKPGWITVSKKEVFPWRIPRPKARENMLKDLRNEAVSKKVGNTLDITSLMTNLMSETDGDLYEQFAQSGFFKSTVSGVITKEKIELDTLDDISSEKGYELQLICNFFVVPVEGNRDPGFVINANLAKNMLNDGDELIINLKSSKSCYVYMFNLMADNNVMMIYPNEYMEDNHIKAENNITVPDDEIRKYLKFRVGTMPAEEITSESIYVVCTKQPIPMIDDLPKVGKSLNTFSGDSNSFIKLQRWLTSVPLDQRIEKALIYHVSKK